MTSEQIATDRAVCNAATPGPWKYRNEPFAWDEVDGWITGPDDQFIAGFDNSPAFDSAFVIAARTRWPAALDEIERLRDLLRRAVRWVQNGTPAVVTYDGKPVGEYREYEADLAAFRELFPDL
jgi:hypothetical protein